MKGIYEPPWKIKAILEHPDQEWQTRRLSGLKEINQHPEIWGVKKHGTDYKGRMVWEFKHIIESHYIKSPYAVGETVYVKEAWAYCPKDFKDTRGIIYKSANKYNEYVASFEWHSPMFMKAVEARYFLLVTGVKAQRVQEITEAEAIAEGMNEGASWIASPRDNYAALWDSTSPHFPWAMNPYIWCIDSRVVDRPCGLK